MVVLFIVYSLWFMEDRDEIIMHYNLPKLKLVTDY